MSDHDTAAALAAQLEELRGQLARCQAAVARQDARLGTEVLGPVMMLRLEVKQQRDRLNEAIEGRKLAPPPAPWWCVGEAEGKAMLAELRQWVETFLRRHYPGYAERLPACWANHPEAAWELSTIRAEWQRIYGAEDNRDLEGALTWHDKWLPGVLSRLAASIRCDEAGCLSARPPPPPR